MTAEDNILDDLDTSGSDLRNVAELLLHVLRDGFTQAAEHDDYSTGLWHQVDFLRRLVEREANAIKAAADELRNAKRESGRGTKAAGSPPVRCVVSS